MLEAKGIVDTTRIATVGHSYGVLYDRVADFASPILALCRDG